MNSRECTFAALNHQQPDRPPLYVSLTPQLAEKLSEAVVSLLPTPSCQMNRWALPSPHTKKSETLSGKWRIKQGRDLPIRQTSDATVVIFDVYPKPSTGKLFYPLSQLLLGKPLVKHFNTGLPFKKFITTKELKDKLKH